VKVRAVGELLTKLDEVIEHWLIVRASSINTCLLPKSTTSSAVTVHTSKGVETWPWYLGVFKFAILN